MILVAGNGSRQDFPDHPALAIDLGEWGHECPQVLSAISPNKKKGEVGLCRAFHVAVK
jgi:hypothetical protein